VPGPLSKLTRLKNRRQPQRIMYTAARQPPRSSIVWAATQGACASGARPTPLTAAKTAGAQSSMRKKSATSYDLVSSVSGWMRSRSSWSFGLSSQEEIGRAYSGWKM